MQRILLLAAMMVPAAMAIDPEARNVKTVYLLKMTAGLDQYLASELTQNGVYAVTTDPKRADAVFTDSLGDTFETKFDELYPPPPKEEKKEDKKAADSSPVPDAGKRVTSSTWSRGKGTVFLVDRKTRNVLWSMQRQTKNTQREAMVEQAKKVTSQLRRDLGLTPPPSK